MTMLKKGLKPVIYDKDKAVSPIIATILLVAITVILASTLYLALGGFFTAKTAATPTVGFSATNTSTSTSTFTYSITLTTPSSNTISWSATDWVVTIGGTTYVANGYSSGEWKWTGPTGATGVFTVSGATGSYVTGGEVLTVSISFESATLSGDITPGAITSIAFDYTGTGGGQMGTTSL